MNTGCVTQAPFWSAIWKLILCPISCMLAPECPYGSYHQHQNHFISLWVSLCDGGNNIFFLGDMESDAQPSDGISLLSFSPFTHLSCWDMGPPKSVFWKMGTRQLSCWDSWRKSVLRGGQRTLSAQSAHKNRSLSLHVLTYSLKSKRTVT